MRSTQSTTCKFCNTSDVFWSWNYSAKEPMLVNDRGHWHRCNAHASDIFPGWCKKCNASDLVWIRKAEYMELTESHGLPHTCEQEHVVEGIDAAHCTHCNEPGLLWIDANNKYTLVNSMGDKHACEQYAAYSAAWREANRINYAMEKKWVKSFPDDFKCKKCAGAGYTTRLSKNKKIMKKLLSSKPVSVIKACKRCKNVGTFNKARKATYLRLLRKRYWPFNGAYHKWKKQIL